MDVVNAATLLAVALPAVLLVLGCLTLRTASECAERRHAERLALSGLASRAQERLAEQSQRALGVLEESLKPVPPSAPELRRQELENAEFERAQAFDDSDPFDDVAVERPSAAPLEDGDEPFGVPGLRLAGRLDDERWA